ncbi:MAG: hypothetical protein GQ544_01375 [Candidatus Aminicenantes bacterium]|nr:hypothetical protein [Candidatus Aminicenantes bacterium]
MILCFLVAACSEEKKDVSVITRIEIGTTNTKLDQEDGIVDEYDMRVSVRIKENAGVLVESLTVTTPSGASFSASKADTGEIEQIDPEYGIEVIRGFESDENEGVWTLAAIANTEYALFGDGFYTITAHYEGGSDSIQLWYGEPNSESPLPFPQNSGFTEPDVKKPMTSPVTFKWEPDPIVQNISVYFASAGGAKSDDLPPNTQAYGPFDYAPGQWELELAVFVERKGKIKDVDYTISKGTVYSTEGVVRE